MNNILKIHTYLQKKVLNYIKESICALKAF